MLGESDQHEKFHLLRSSMFVAVVRGSEYFPLKRKVIPDATRRSDNELQTQSGALKLSGILAEVGLASCPTSK
jgi:hypothetical protein